MDSNPSLFGATWRSCSVEWGLLETEQTHRHTQRHRHTHRHICTHRHTQTHTVTQTYGCMQTHRTITARRLPHLTLCRAAANTQETQAPQSASFRPLLARPPFGGRWRRVGGGINRCYKIKCLLLVSPASPRAMPTSTRSQS